MSKSVVRSVKNVTKGYSHVEVKVRNATSNDPWGPTGSEMSEIAQMTFNNSIDFEQIMNMLDKRLNDKGKNWRHVLKSLKVMDYCLHEGSELVVTWARKNIFIIKTLREFQYIDEDGRDVGLNVRTSAKELTALILDEERLRAERRDRKLWKSRVTGLEEFGSSPTSGGPIDPYGVRNTNKPERRQRRANNDEDDLEYKLAIEASKNEAEEEAKRRARNASNAGENDDDLAKAIKLSKEEEELRRRELEEQNANSLFDDTPAPSQQPQVTGWNQGYQQQPAVDWMGNPVDTQSTGYLNNAYAPQQTGFGNQFTGYQNGYGYQQTQPTGFDQSNPYSQFSQQPQQQQQQQQQQPQYLQSQQTSFNVNNPYGQFGQPEQQPQQQQQDTLQPGSNNPWSTQNQADSLAPLKTGSNNPFASTSARPQPVQSNTAPTLSSLQDQRTATQSNYSFQQQSSTPFSNYTQSHPAQPPPQQQQQPLHPQQTTVPGDPHHANLNTLLQNRADGQDTFGNTGELRIPAQHTAPGTFVNSAGAGLSKLNPNQTGAFGANNPFGPQITGQPAQPQYPAQTGPAFGVGGGLSGQAFGGSNPFGAQRQQGGQGQGPSLIDI